MLCYVKLWLLSRKCAKFYNFCPIACGQKEWYLKDGEEMPDKEHPVSALIILIYLTLF